ncbi:IS66 family insertion sequence element accessory protein TnpA [Desulfoferrobacter suflitae]
MNKAKGEDREARRRFWEEHLGEWEASGPSQSEYCRRNDLNLPSLCPCT